MTDYILKVLMICVKREVLMQYVNEDDTHPYIMVLCRKGESYPGYLIINTKAPVTEEVIIPTFEDALQLLSAMVHNIDRPESVKISEYDPR